MKTKLLALLLTLVMVVSMLASCDLFGDGEEEGCAHIDGNGDRMCDACGETVGKPVTEGSTETGEKLPDVTWGVTTQLLYQMSHDSNNGELSSGCEKYLAGGGDGQSSVEVAVRERNTLAMNYANVEVEYTYYQEGTAGWGSSIKKMYDQASSKTDAGRPDIFCNFVYDMVSSSLMGAFNNLYTNKVSSASLKAGELRNYFEFATDGHYDMSVVDTGDGYMIEYMQSLTLSEDKMYLLASDYFTDLVRAFFAVPVNIAVLEVINPSTDPESYLYDYIQDGKYTIDDFYALVRAGRWNYDAVKAFSAQVYRTPNNAANVLEANGNGRYGWAVAHGGLAASGLIYTTSMIVIHREVTEVESTDPDNPGMVQSYKFYYEPSAGDLSKFATNLASLFSSTGVVCVTKTAGEDGNTSVNTTTSGTAENEIQAAFARGQVLFGGIICVGSLEDSIYRGMSADGGKGFGVVPVPLYRTSYEENGETKVDKYLTQIHNIGRVGAIAINTKKFAEASAFLNYQSVNSARILDQYYELTLKFDAAGGTEGNGEMLDYIRANVRSSFDKAFEDAIARHASNSGDKTLNSNKWHNIIQAYNYVMPDGAMNTKYTELLDTKDLALQALDQSYSNLPE